MENFEAGITLKNCIQLDKRIGSVFLCVHFVYTLEKKNQAFSKSGLPQDCGLTLAEAEL